jgi:hypothetical protein
MKEMSKVDEKMGQYKDIGRHKRNKEMGERKI